MQHFRGLPLFLRTTQVAALLCSLTALLLLGWGYFALSPAYPGSPFLHTMTIALSLVLLGGAFLFPNTLYATRLYYIRQRSPEVQTVPPRSWQSQVWPLALLAALPVAALTLAFVVPPSRSSGSWIFTLLIAGGCLDIVAIFWMTVWTAVSAQRQLSR
jgi:hypothetical protein